MARCLLRCSARLLALLLLAPASICSPVPAGASPARRPAQQAVGGDADFDGDGYADLAVSAEDWSGDGERGFPGVVTVLYGTPRGLTQSDRQRWTAADFVVGDRSDMFGDALAAGDFDGDGYSDLAVGVAEDPSDRSEGNAGSVRILYGSPAGLTRARTQRVDQNTPGIKGTAEDGDGFGSTQVAADFGRGRQDDLAVGVSGENGLQGAVNLIYGSPAGLTAVGNQIWSQATKGVPGRRAAKDVQELFGASLAAGHLAGSDYADLAIGVPGDPVRGREDAGAVNVLHGSAAGLTTRRAQRWTQDSAGIKGRPEAMDGFGTSLVAAHFSGRKAAQLAVGVPGENSWRGAVQVIGGSSRGLTAKGDQMWSARTVGLGGRSRLGDSFGIDMAAGNFGYDAGHRGFADLVIRVEDAKTGRSIVEVVHGSRDGLTTKHSRLWDPDSRGIAGTAELGQDFGSALLTADLGCHEKGQVYDELVIADPWYDAGGAFTIICGSPTGLTSRDNQLWTTSSLREPGLQFLGTALAGG